MKKIKILSILLMAVGIFACTELTEEPVGVLAPEGFFKTTSDVEAALFGAYGHMASERYWGRKFYLTVLLRSDMVDIGNRGTPSRRRHINDFQSDAYNGMVTNFWPRSYEIISAANAAIAGAESLDGADVTEVNQLIAEARFVRAFVYFNLVRWFGDIPYIGEAVTDPEALAEISKTPEAEVFGNIKADLQFAIANLPMTQATNARAKKASAYAMLADVHLTLGEYGDAYTNAKWVIDNAVASKVELDPDYQNLFDASTNDGQKEFLFTIDFLGQTNGPGAGNGDDLLGPLTGVRGTDMQGWGVAVPSMAVFDSWDERDYRKGVSFTTEAAKDGELIPYTEFTNEKRPHIAKYTRFPGTADQNNRYSDRNYPVYRYADVLLMAAEAGNEVNGPNSELEGYVNLVRARARNAAGTMNDYPEDVASGMTKDQFRDMVMEERRLELAFEGKRWYDIRRRKMGDEVFKGANSLEPHDNFNDNQYLLALPQDELDRNPNLLPQNPGY